jgi:hypothetical protein
MLLKQTDKAGRRIRGKRIFFLFFLMMSAGASLPASPNNYLLGARFSAMANATVMIPDLWSLSHNQAGLGWITSPVVGFHFENKFAVPQYSLSALGAAIPMKPGTMGLMFYYFGYSQYHDIRFALSFGRAFTERFAAGVQLNYIGTYIADDYGTYHSIVAEGGIIAEPVDNLYIGAHVYNFTASKMTNPEREKLPVIFRVGVGYEIKKIVFVSVETEKNLDEKAVFRTGVELNALQNFFLRAGYSSNPSRPSFGLGYIFKGFRGDLAFTLHPQLGFTPYFSLLYSF